MEPAARLGFLKKSVAALAKRGIIYRLTFSFNANSIFLIYS